MNYEDNKKLGWDMLKQQAAKYPNSEALLRAGGFSDDALNLAAFGFTESSIKTLMPDQLNIKWKEDYKNVIQEQQASGLSKVDWAKRINLTEPIDVSYEKNKFFIEDGHHRYYAAKILKKPLNVNLEINQNPIMVLDGGKGDYDKLHRAFFKESREVDTEVTIKAHDAEGIIEKMFNYIKSIGNQGHSFSIEVDPDSQEYSKLFGWDGDGSAYIDSIEVKKIMEDINLDIDKGDTILTGRFKNHKVEVKDIGEDEHGMPTVNGKQITKIRIPKLEETYLNNKMTPQEATALKQISRLAKTIGFPQTEDVTSKRIFWNRESGMRGKNTIDRVKENCELNRWTKGGVTNITNNVGDVNSVSFTDPTSRYRIVFNTVFGPTTEDNKYSIELKHIGVNESLSLIDKILKEAIKK